MSGVIATQRADSQLRYLSQTLERFEAFHIANQARETNDFCDWFTQDDVLGIVAQSLFDRIPISPKEWHAKAHAEGKVPPLPDDPMGAFAFRWGCLRYLRSGKLDLRYFVANLFGGAHLNEMLMNWKRLIVHPFAADCRTLAEDLLAKFTDEQWVRFQDMVGEYLDGEFGRRGFGPRAWNDADDAAVEAAESSSPAPAPVPVAKTPDVDEALDALESAVRKGPGGDALHDVAALRLEGQRGQRMASRIRARLNALRSASSTLSDACSAAESALL